MKELSKLIEESRKEEQNQILDFVSKNCIIKESTQCMYESTLLKAIRKEYVIVSLDRNDIYSIIKKMFPSVDRSRIGKRGGGSFYYKNISLKEGVL